MPLTPSEFYDPNPDGRLLAQGDVVDGVTFVWTPPKNKRWVLMRPLPAESLKRPVGGLPRTFKAYIDGELQTAWERDDGELVMAAGYAQTCMILSQSCDLDHRKNVQIAPVSSLTDITNDRTRNNVRAGDVGYFYYLPPNGDFPESYADLNQITTIDPSYLRIDQLRVRLSPRGLVDFMNLLSDYFAKPFGFNTHDTVPQTSAYRCAHCFFSGGSVVELQMHENDAFASCPACGDAVLWVKVIC